MMNEIVHDINDIYIETALQSGCVSTHLKKCNIVAIYTQPVLGAKSKCCGHYLYHRDSLITIHSLALLIESSNSCCIWEDVCDRYN